MEPFYVQKGPECGIIVIRGKNPMAKIAHSKCMESQKACDLEICL